MVVGRDAYSPDCCALVRDQRAVPPGFLDDRLVGTADRVNTGILTHGGRNGSLGWAIVFRWHSPFSRRAGAHAPLPGLITGWRRVTNTSGFHQRGLSEATSDHIEVQLF
jgi:hypothetical protein